MESLLRFDQTPMTQLKRNSFICAQAKLEASLFSGVVTQNVRRLPPRRLAVVMLLTKNTYQLVVSSKQLDG